MRRRAGQLLLHRREIEKLGGKVVRDEKAEGKPVREVDLSYKKVTDADLKELTACKQLQFLHLTHCTQVTEAGLKELAAGAPKAAAP